MHVTLQMALVAAVLCAAWCEPGADPGSRIVRAKQPRATRGFKNTEMMTARGFGKRNYHAPREAVRRPRASRVFRNSELSVARGFGKRNADSGDEEVFGLDNFWDMLEASPERGQQEQTEDKTFESIPVDWLVDEMLSSPEFTKTVVRKFLDINQDGVLSSDELLRNVY